MPQATKISLSQIGQIAINVQEPQRATAFYRDTLGMKHLFSAGDLSFFDCGGIRLMLTAPEKEEFRRSGSILYFRVADVHQAYQDLKERGVRFEDEPHLIARMETHDLWMTFFRDSENNLLSLMSEAAKEK